MAKTKEKQEQAPSNVEPFPSSSIAAYETAAEAIKADLWNSCIDHLDDDFPMSWLIGILTEIQLDLQLTDYEE